MTVVWKYPIPVNVLSAGATTVHRIPTGARLLHCAPQHDAICMWWEIPDPDAAKQQHGFQIFGTGGESPIRDGLTYRGTVLLVGGDLVLHVYETEQDQP